MSSFSMFMFDTEPPYISLPNPTKIKTTSVSRKEITMSTSTQKLTKNILILLVIFAVLTAFRLLWLFYHAPTNQPIARDGVSCMENIPTNFTGGAKNDNHT